MDVPAPRRLAPFFVALLLVAPLAQASPREDPLGLKADAALLAALDAGAAKLSVIVVGPAHAPLDADAFSSRAAALAHLGLAAAPFLDGLARDAAAYGAVVTHTWAAAPAAKLLASPAAVRALAARDDVRAVALDHDGALSLPPLEPGSDVGAANNGTREMIQAEEIWALGYRGEGTTIAIIDTGIDASHEAFRRADGSSRVVAWIDARDGLPTPYDDHGHGTHVAATAAGSALYEHPTSGIFQEQGVAPEATLIVAKFLSGSGSGTFEDAMDALTWAYTSGADVASNSWGATCGSSVIPVLSLVRTLTDAGMVSVFAAGNSGPGASTVGGPACGESAITVGSVDANRVIASSSGRGPCADPDVGGPMRICPDLVMKGRDVRSAIPRTGAGNADPSGYKVWSGTSMATPGVAGGVALIEQMKRAITGTGWNTSARQEEEVLKATALDLGPPGPDDAYGWGLPQLLNVYALLDATDEARIVHTFAAPAGPLRLHEGGTLAFSVRNLGGAATTGTFQATLTAPDGSVRTLADETRSLALLEERRVSTVFQVDGSVPPGTYEFAASYDYTWTNATSGEVVHEVVAEAAAFEVRRVFLQTDVEGVERETTPLDPQDVHLDVRNVGNDVATNVRVEATFTDDYLALPPGEFDPTDPNARWADPAPDEVREDKNFGRVTLTWALDDLAPGDSWDASMRLLSTTPGTYSVLVVVKYCDPAGTCTSQGVLAPQTVAAPAP